MKLDKSTAVCKICRFSTHYTGNTTNLNSHLTKHHSDVMKGQSQTQKQPSIATAMQSQQKLSFKSLRASAITKAIAEFILLDLKPIATVESDAFRNMMMVAEPRYVVPSRNYFAQTLFPKMYEEAKRDITERIRALDLAVTSDCWTSHATQSYLTVTGHGVTDDWEMENYVLQTRELPGSHTGEHLADELESCQNEWGFGKPIMVTDNAANALKCAVLLGWLDIPCVAHTLNLAAKAGLKVSSVAKILSKCRLIVGYFKRSALAMDILHKKQVLLQLPKVRLIQDVETRWNATYDMLERLLEQTAAIHAAFTQPDIKKSSRGLLLTSDEQVVAEEVMLVMKELKTATVLLCGQKNPTVSIILPVLKKLEVHLMPNPNDSKLVANVKAAIWDNLKDRYQDEAVRHFLLVASLIDPMYKDMKFVSNEDKLLALAELTNAAKLFATGISTAATTVVKQEPQDDIPVSTVSAAQPLPALPSLLSDIAGPSYLPMPEPDDIKPSLSDRDDVSEPLAKKAKPDTDINDWLGDVVFVCKEEPPNRSLDDRIAQEIDQYSNALPAKEFGTSLSWWKHNHFLYPLLARVAKKFLGVPGTSVPSERVFSITGMLVNKQRSSLHPDNVDMLTFLNKNYKLVKRAMEK